VTLLLAGDIGGTKTLLSLYGTRGSGLEPLRETRFVSAEWTDLALMVREFLAQSRAAGLGHPEAACLAVAGPVVGGQARLTNLPWGPLVETALEEACAIPRLDLVNDFAVLVYGLPHLEAAQLAEVRAGSPAQGEPLLVLGAGTGLGVAIGVPSGGELLALATEGGHGTFAPRTEEEWRLSQWLKADLGTERLSIERVVSGTGLGAVARWLLAERHPEGDHPLCPLARGGESVDLGQPVGGVAFPGVPGAFPGEGAAGGPAGADPRPGDHRSSGGGVQRGLSGPHASWWRLNPGAPESPDGTLRGEDRGL